MPTAEHDQACTELLRLLGIPKGHPEARQVRQFLMYCHHGRLRSVCVQFRQERRKAEQRQKRGKSLTPRQSALLDPASIWPMARGAYNQLLRDYAFLYVTFNLLEDSLRQLIAAHYTAQHGTRWFSNPATYPDWVREAFTNRNKLAMATTRRNSHAFTDLLSFGELAAFLYTPTAWTDYGTSSLFEAQPDPEAPELTLPALTRCEVYERLTILQWRRNSVYHHKLIPKKYRPPSDEGCPGRVAEMNDGTFANTRDRLYELFRYMGLRPTYVAERIVGSSGTFPGPLEQ